MLTSSAGAYLFAYLPPGDYVVSFEREDVVTVKRTTHVSPTMTVVADAVMSAATVPHDAIVVAIEPRSFSRWPGLTQTYDQATLERLPVGGGTRSALSLAAGPLGVSSEAALVSLVSFDGTPVRIDQQMFSAPLLDPGVVALQEVTLATGGLPAEVGHLESGMVAVVTRPGGIRPSGELRTGLSGAGLNSDVAETAAAPSDGTRTIDYRIGGPLYGSRVWLFGAGRAAAGEVASHARLTDAVFPSPTHDRFWQAKATHALGSAHRLQALFVSGARSSNASPPVDTVSAEDRAALEDRTERHRLISAAYTGVLGRHVQLTARVSLERAELETTPSDAAGPAARIPIRDQQSGGLISASGACPACSPEAQTSATWRVMASRLMELLGAHELSAGYESTLGRIEPQGTHPAGSFELMASRFVVGEGRVAPAFEPNGSALILWRPDVDNRLTLGADAFFVGDVWRLSRNLTVLAGLRWERHRLSTYQAPTQRILTESGLSPRVHVVWQPSGSRGWLLTSGYARYAPDLSTGLDSRVVGPAEHAYRYSGPAINASPEAAVVESGDAGERVLGWFLANGGTARVPSSVSEPGTTALRPELLGLPHVSEWTIGAGHTLGRARTRIDLVWRSFDGLREWQVNAGTTDARDSMDHLVDQAVPASTGLLSRTYAALATQVDYDLGLQASIGAHYTLARSRGTADPAYRRNSPSSLASLAYREYVDRDWAAPEGDLSDDRRHRLKVWAHTDVLESESLGVLRVDVLQTFESGRPFGIASLIDVTPFVSNPGYHQPPLSVPYYFTARDEFRTKPMNRTDVAVQYTRRVPGTLRTEWIAGLHILNLFDKRWVLRPEAFVAAATAYTEPSLHPFDPFATAPVQGVHWMTDARLSEAVSSALMTIPRTYRLSVGIRF